LSEAQTVLVTGATDGIGRATATALGARGWRVLVHGRDESKARHAAGDINGIPVWGDFSDLAAVTRLAETISTVAPTLDALVNNAGIYATSRTETAHGLEMTMAVNYFAPFLLTHHLLPLLTRSPAGRIVNVSSMTHSGARLDPKQLDFERGWDAYGVYAASKLANILFTRQLAVNLKRTAVTANALHPGVIGTKLLRAGFATGGASVQDGARTSVFLVDNGSVKGVSGQYYIDCKSTQPSRAARDARLARNLWDATYERLVAYL